MRLTDLPSIKETAWKSTFLSHNDPVILEMAILFEGLAVHHVCLNEAATPAKPATTAAIDALNGGTP